jgi:hypothetical protein
MPRYYRQNGEKFPNVRFQKAWIEIPVRSDFPIMTEHYLVQTRVADYIVLLESKIKGALPKLSKKIDE